MGFWSTVFEIADGVLAHMAVGQSHPALQKAWDRYLAKGYEIVSVDTYEMTGRKEGLFSVSTVTLRVDYDGSVLVEEEGALTESMYVIAAGPLTPTIEEFEAQIAQARRAAQDHGAAPGSASASGGGGGDHRSGAHMPGASADRARALALLGLSAGATPEQIRSAYRAKAQQYHPDAFNGAPQEFRDLAHEKMAELNDARDLLLGR